MLEARGVSMCAHVCPQQELGGCVWSSTSALAVYGAQRGMWGGGRPLEVHSLLGCFRAPLGVGP